MDTSATRMEKENSPRMSRMSRRSTQPGLDVGSKASGTSTKTKASAATKILSAKSLLSKGQRRKRKRFHLPLPKPVLFEASPREWWEVALVEYA